MKKQKMLNLDEIKGALTRSQMKKIMAGSGFSCSANCGGYTLSVGNCITCTANDGWGVSCSTSSGTEVYRCD